MYNRWPKYRLCTGSRLSSFSSSLLCSAVSVSVREQGVHRTGHFVNFNSIWASVLRFSAWAKCMIHAEFETWWVPLDLVWNFCLHKWLVFQEFCLRVNRNCWGLLNILKTGNENVDQLDQFGFLGNRARYDFIELDMSTGLDKQIELRKPSSIRVYRSRYINRPRWTNRPRETVLDMSIPSSKCRGRWSKDSHFSGGTRRMLSSSISLTIALVLLTAFKWTELGLR